MIRHALPLASVFCVALAATAPAARADIPDIDEAVLKEPCDAARALDACPTCTCKLRTSTVRDGKLAEALETSTVPLGVVAVVEGKKADGVDFASAHALLGTREKLTHIGRFATSHVIGDNGFLQFDVLGGKAAWQMCPGGCDFEAVGAIHPFEFTTTETASKMLDDGTMEDTVREETRLLLCFEGLGGLSCGSMPLKLEKKVQRPPMAPGMKLKVLSHEGYARTWKFGKAGDIAFGKASGKLAHELARPEAFKVPIVSVLGEQDARPIER